MKVYYKIAHLDINPNPISFLDDMLLFVCLPSFFLYGILNLMWAMVESTEDNIYFLNAFPNVLMVAKIKQLILIRTGMLVILSVGSSLSPDPNDR